MSPATPNTERYDQSALRHFRDATYLAKDARWDGAGHLVGFAAESALKHAIASLRPGQDVPHKHFPELITIAKKHIQLKNHRGIRTLLDFADYFAGWKIDDRYSADGTVSSKAYDLWRDHATRTISAAGLRST